MGKGARRRPAGTGAVGNRRVTVIDVARAAGVSPMTVSNVVNGRHRMMSGETRRAVEAVIERLGYRPQTAGRSLKLARRFSIGMVVIDESPAFLADPFITQLVAGLSNYLSERGYGLFMQGIVGERLPSSPLIRRHETDALCVLLSGAKAVRQRHLALLAGLGQPVILFQEPAPRDARDLLVIRQDDYGGARQLAELVLARGVRDVVFLVSALSWPAIEQREQGIRAALAAARRPVRFTVLSCGAADFAATQAALAAHVAACGTPDAVMGGNDRMGIAALQWLRARRLKVPADVLVTGYNAFETWQYTDPPLTTVISSAYEMGCKGGEAILARLQGRDFEPKEILFPVRLQEGRST